MGGVWELVEKGKGTKKYKSVVTIQSQNVKYSTGNLVSNIVISIYGARWVLELSGGSLCKLHKCLTRTDLC